MFVWCLLQQAKVQDKMCVHDYKFDKKDIIAEVVCYSESVAVVCQDAVRLSVTYDRFM